MNEIWWSVPDRSLVHPMYKGASWPHDQVVDPNIYFDTQLGGDTGTRTLDPLLAKQVL